MPQEVHVDQAADTVRFSERQSKLAQELVRLDQRMASYRQEEAALQRILSGPCNSRLDRQLRLNNLRRSLIPLLQISIDSLRAFLGSSSP